MKLWDPASGRERASLSGPHRHGDVPGVLGARGNPRHRQPRHDREALGAGTWRERASLQGHRDGVSALAFGADARQMATGGFDGSVRLWEPAAPVFSPSACLAYAGEARGLAFSPDGRTLRAGGDAGIARWDARTGSALPPAEAWQGQVMAIAAAPDGTTSPPVRPTAKSASSTPAPTVRSRHCGGTSAPCWPRPFRPTPACSPRAAAMGLLPLGCPRPAASGGVPGGSRADRRGAVLARRPHPRRRVGRHGRGVRIVVSIRCGDALGCRQPPRVRAP